MQPPGMPATFTFEFTVSDAELGRASRLMSLRRRSTRLTLWFVATMGVGAAALSQLTLPVSRALTWPPPPPLSFLLMTAIMFYFIIYFLPRLHTRVSRDGMRGKDGPHRCILSDLGLAVSGLGVQVSYEWENVLECVETEEFFFFYVSQSQAQVLPKKVISSSTTPALRDALRSWLGGRLGLREAPA